MESDKKPISELYLNKEACSAIHKLITRGDFKESHRETTGFHKLTAISGWNNDMCPDATRIEIFDDGEICFLEYRGGRENQLVPGNVFKLVDLIRSFGYEPLS